MRFGLPIPVPVFCTAIRLSILLPDAHPDSEMLAEVESNKQYQAWDMLSGRLSPELGGDPRYLDLIGANYYHDNQWELFTHQKLNWHLGDVRRKPLHEMLEALFERYQRPILLAETSHVGSGRGAWIKDVSSEVAHALLSGVDIQGFAFIRSLTGPTGRTVRNGTTAGCGTWRTIIRTLLYAG